MGKRRRDSGRSKPHASSGRQQSTHSATIATPAQASETNETKSASESNGFAADPEGPSLSGPSDHTTDLARHVHAILRSLDNEEDYRKSLEYINIGWDLKKAERSAARPSTAQPPNTETSNAQPPIAPPLTPSDFRMAMAISLGRPSFPHQKFPTIAAVKKYWRENPKCKAHLLSLPGNVKFRIFKEILVKKGHGVKDSGDICPFYSHALVPDIPLFNQRELDIMTQHGVPEIWMKDLPNVDLGLLSVNKHLNALCSRIYYSTNVFVFNDARSCFWFFKRIGQTNLSYIRNVVFNISSGFFLSRKNRSVFEKCEEQRWVQVFHFLRFRHGFQHFILRFVGFHDLEDRLDLSNSDKLSMSQGRLALVRLLSSFRGMKNVLMENDECKWIEYEARRKVVQDMVQPAEPFPFITSEPMEEQIESL